MVKESMYQAKLIKKLEKMFPGCIVLKNDSGYIQGIPDLTILYKDRWAVLEVKASSDSPNQANQQFYVEKLGSMSYSAFICPENEKVVLDDLQHTFGLSRSACIFES
jgi:hypothetical protein